MIPSRSLATLVLLLAAGSVSAHPGHETASFASGFGHPFGGLDHLLAMLAVGLYAALQPRTARWALPAGFVAAMLAGAVLGAAGFALPAVETGISASVLILGLLIAFVVRLPIHAALPLVATFALFHGYAHHAEMGEGSLLSYAGGFAIATATLHGLGFMFARWLPETAMARTAKRVIGVAIATAGAVLLGA